jgi:signal transduction histidine kinase
VRFGTLDGPGVEYHAGGPPRDDIVPRLLERVRRTLTRLYDRVVLATNTHRPALQRYALAAALAILSLGLHRPLQRLFGDAVPFHLLYPVVMVSAWFGGWGPGLLVTFSTALAGALVFEDPYFTFALASPQGVVRVGAFILTGTVISVLCEALHGARRREEVARLRIERLAAQRADLDAVAVALAEALHVSEVAEVVLERGRRMLGARAGSLAVIDPSRGGLRILHAVGYPPGVAEKDALIDMASAEPMAEAVRERCPVVLESRFASDTVYPHLAPVRDRTGTQAVAVLPLLVRQRVLGGLGFSFLETRGFDAESLALLHTLAYQCALALERAQLYEAERASRLEAQRLNRVKDEFLAILSHELRTPLSAIRIWLDLLRTERLPPGAGRALEMIDRSALNLSQLIGELLDVSRIVAGKLTLNPHPVSLPDLVDAVLETARPAASAKKIRLHAEVDRSLGRVFADGSRLRQALENLVANAVKFTPRSGAVEVRLTAKDGHAVLSVEDTGVGIAPDLLPYVFERFRQGDSSSTRAQQGLGLGLTIAQHLVELHRGTISASSPGVGKGSVFTIEVPLVTPPLASASLPASTQDAFPERALYGLHVLLVDDHQDTLRGVTLALEANGAAVTAVSSASAALAELDRRAPDVLVSDIAMPGMDGHDLIRSVRGRPRAGGGSTPAIALSAYVSPEDRARALEAGYGEHVTKPVEIPHLVATIARLAAR